MNRVISRNGWLVLCVLFVLAFAGPARAQIVYAWVPDRASGGQGTLVFDEAALSANHDGATTVYTNPGNFITPLSNPPLLSINFTFDNGFSIDEAHGFSTATTIQNALGFTQFQALNGRIAGFADGGFSFAYTHAIGGAQHAYTGTTVDQIHCVTLPCPQRGAHFAFAGPARSQVHTGRFVLVTDPADLDHDGDVDDADFGLAFAAFTGPNSGSIDNHPADLDGDGDVDDADFGLFFAAYTGPNARTSVPEPGSLALLAFAGFVVLRRRR